MDVKDTGGLKLNDSATCDFITKEISLPLKKHILSKIADTSLKTFFFLENKRSTEANNKSWSLCHMSNINFACYLKLGTFKCHHFWLICTSSISLFNCYQNTSKSAKVI